MERSTTGGGSALELLNETSRLLAEADTVDDFIDVRKQTKAVSDVFRDLKVQKQLVLEAACQMVRAEHGLGRLLAQLPLAKGSSGNQRTGKVDRSHDGTGPFRLEELGISKNASQRAQRIGLVSEKQLEQWLTELCEKGKTPTLKGALDLANMLHPPVLEGGASNACKCKQSLKETKPTRDLCHENPLTMVQDALKHLKIVGEQLEPLYKDSPIKTLKRAELKTIKHFLQELADELAGLERYHHNHPAHPPPHI